MLNDAMFSIVEDRNDKTAVVVRARRKGDIEKVFTKFKDKVIESSNSDYRFRIFADRQLVSELIANEVMRIDYDNFKNSVGDRQLRSAYGNIWTVLYDVQEKNHPRDSNWWLDYASPSRYK